MDTKLQAPKIFPTSGFIKAYSPESATPGLLFTNSSAVNLSTCTKMLFMRSGYNSEFSRRLDFMNSSQTAAQKQFPQIMKCHQIFPRLQNVVKDLEQLHNTVRNSVDDLI